VVDEEITPHTVLTAEKMESLLNKEREKYMKIINNLTDQIKEAGCELDHPFDRESMCITNTLANNLLNIIDMTETRLRNAYTTNKIAKFEYEFILQVLKKD
jgi:hypothetical protein